MQTLPSRRQASEWKTKFYSAQGVVAEKNSEIKEIGIGIGVHHDT
jgi:hypothetical protein